MKTTNLPPDDATGGVPGLPCLEGGAGPRPRHQGAAQAPAQGDGAVQEAEGELHLPVCRFTGQCIKNIHNAPLPIFFILWI